MLHTAHELRDKAMPPTGASTAVLAAAEEEVCLRALSKSNVPKLTDADLVAFKAVLADVFPVGWCG